MKINYNLTGAKRKALVSAISQELNKSSSYLGAPSFAYEIGQYQVDKSGILQGPDNPGLVADLCGLYSFDALTAEFDTTPAKAESVTEDVKIPYDVELGGRTSPYRDYEEPPVYVSPDSLVIELPSIDFTEAAFANLEKTISAKSSLIKKALGAEDLTIERTESTIRFPWFVLEPGNEAVCVNAYTHFVFGLCKLAKTQQRVNDKEKSVENDKYAFRCFLLRLGLIGLLTGGENAREKIKLGVAETISTIQEILPQIKEILLTIIEVAAEVVPEIIQSIVGFIVENLPEILKMGTEILLKLVGGILQAIPEIAKQLPAVVTAIVEAMQAFAPQFQEIGKDIVRGIWQGILGLGAWLKEKMNDFFGGLVGGIKGLLGIKSPSKVFAGIGENMATGLGDGFSEQMKQVKKQLSSAIPHSNLDLGLNSSQGDRTTSLGESLIMVNVPLTLDGKLLISSTGKVQYGRNQSYARALGVIPV